ncbi:MAG: hypothetical protein AAFQ67_03615 [Pseudomonadota bacterium]
MRIPTILLSALLLCACDPAADNGAADAVRLPAPFTEAPIVATPPELTEAAQAKVDIIVEAAKRDRLRAFSRLAEKEPGFSSNFADEAHYTHWDLLRRTGVDPLAKVQNVLAEPHAAVQVGDETWFVWPDLAARDPEELLPEKLSFRDRARLLELVGEPGLDRIRAGEPYPGFRVAVADDGRWIYFLHETGETSETIE